MSDTIVIKPAVQQQFDHFLQYGRILFFSAPCGFGKTVLSGVLLAGQNVLCSARWGKNLPENHGL